MSWFFGKKKSQRDSPPSSEDESENREQGDEFIFVEKKNQSRPGANDTGSGENLYPNINNFPQYPPLPPPAAAAAAASEDLPRQNSIDPIQNIINDLPFKLCKQLVDNINDDIEIDSLRVNEILAHILRLQNNDFVYDFSMEKSVINEMDSADAM